MRTGREAEAVETGLDKGRLCLSAHPPTTGEAVPRGPSDRLTEGRLVPILRGSVVALVLVVLSLLATLAAVRM